MAVDKDRIQEIANRYGVIVYCPKGVRLRCKDAYGIVVGFVKHDGRDCARVTKAAREIESRQQ